MKLSVALCASFFVIRKENPVNNNAFLQLTDEERSRKLDIAIRHQTDNLLNAEQISSIMQSISPGHQYHIVVHPVNRDGCETLVVENVLHIYVPEHLYEKK
jgi:hypothetical protein